MAKISRQVGTTGHVLTLFIQDSTSTTGAGLTGLAYNSSGLSCYYKRNRGTASVAVTLATITTLGTYVSGGFKEVDATNLPGIYEFHPPDTALDTGAGSVVLMLRGAANMVPCLIEIELTATNNQDAQRGGITALPAASTLLVKPAVTLAPADVSGNLPVDLQTIKTQAVTAAAAVAFPASIGTSTYAGADTAGTATLLTRLTSTRAGLLDNLDAAVSTRSTYAGGDTSGTATLLTRIGSALSITSGKVAATVAAGDNADSAAIKATIGVAGAGLTAIPYTGPPALTDYQQRSQPVTLPTGGVLLAASQTNYAPAKAGDAMTVAGNVTVGGYATGQDPATLTGMSPTSRTLTAFGFTVAATVADKTGYSLTQAFPSNFATLAIEAGTGKVTTANPSTGGVDTTALANTLAAKITTDHGSGSYVTPATVTVGDKTGFVLAASGLDAVAIEAGVNARQTLVAIASALVGNLSGADTEDVAIKGINSAVTRIEAETDASGNRTVTLHLPS